MWKVVVTTVVLGGIALFFALSIAGMFDKPEIQERDIGPYSLVFKKVEGEYQQASLYGSAVRLWLSENGIKGKLEMAMFFDDPRQTDEKLLRYIIGWVIDEPDEETRQAIQEQYLVRTFPRQRCLVAIFPYRSKLTPVFGLAKVYPALDAYRADKGYANHPVIEMLDKKEKQMIYLQPLEPGVDMVEKYYLFQETLEITTPVVE
ncbi:hypothetical protein K8S19_01115 [bacterium]|nr:hypothetical protein [bacterium]